MIKIDPELLNLDPRNTKFEKAFEAIKEELVKSMLATICITDCHKHNTNASFGRKYAVNMVNVDENDVEYFEDTHTIHFKKDNSFYFFIHEAMHFMHLSMDGGKFRMPAMATEKAAKFEDGKDMRRRTMIEREAGFRTIMFALAYNLDVEYAKQDNIRNMLFYRSKHYEWLNIEELAYKVLQRVGPSMKFSDTMNLDDIDIQLTADEETYYNQHKEDNHDC